MFTLLLSGERFFQCQKRRGAGGGLFACQGSRRVLRKTHVAAGWRGTWCFNSSNEKYPGSCHFTAVNQVIPGFFRYKISSIAIMGREVSSHSPGCKGQGCHQVFGHRSSCRCPCHRSNYKDEIYHRLLPRIGGLQPALGSPSGNPKCAVNSALLSKFFFPGE